jgi:hypothetical protein
MLSKRGRQAHDHSSHAATDRSAVIEFANELTIELTGTDDDAHGPCPPPEGDDWHVVRRGGGTTLWRKLGLT